MQPDPLSLEAIRAAVGDWARGERLVRRAFLFGSRARGSPRPDSDLDIALVCDADRTVPRNRRADPEQARVWTFVENRPRWAAALGARLPVAVDLQPLWRDGAIVHPAVRREGLVLYRRR